MSKPKAHQPTDLDPIGGKLFSVRFLLMLVLVALGIAWIVFYYSTVRVAPFSDAEPGGPAFLGDLGKWNYLIGFGLIMVGLMVASHPSTPLGRGRGVVVGMLGCFLLGLLWICTFYVFSGTKLDDVWVLNDLDQWNLVVGIGFMAVGFAYATRWE